MSFLRIRPADIQIGHALPWDVFDGKGTLLLSRGQTVSTDTQLERLLEIGVFAETALLTRTRNEAPRARTVTGSARPPSVVAMLEQVRKRLDHVVNHLATLVSEQTLGDEIRGLAAMVENASRGEPNVALAMVILRQEGRYATRQMVNVAVVSRLVAVSMDMTPDDVRAVVCAALTMNLTKVALQDAMQRQTEPLTAQQREEMERHPREARDLLLRAGVNEPLWLDSVLQHHEHIDGSGYPGRLTDGAIVLGAQVLALADLFCARVTSRAYRPAVSSNVALRGILLERGKGIDPVVAGHFIKTLGVYPPGLMVRLANGEIGIVVKHGSKPNCPVVASLIGPRGAPLSLVLRRDTSIDLYTIRETVDPNGFSAYVRMESIWGDTARTVDE
ncbi:HD-GYP domain-containing protein [Chitiniphilus eburneus]|uniref:HD-GYP domain-containing protein n=1 Tax=Chitiniphilus eburneus TaxID=2571148 RepID=A0A4U0PKH8_9NEIS|nr:HD domain-containing phosphohydrolase [Chitiniphilus eburneus]TJZ68603.1 hypothetical protein FAZ21_15460 [Chitiniphilus eburneus]